jgi:soluble lytic murein transglycosylase-like protein
LPESLVHRVVKAESRYNARAVGRGGAMGLMQIKHATARGMGYTGTPVGLLDPETNLTYAVRYLAGAYQAAGGNADGAVSNYRRGYYKSKRRVARVQVASPSPGPLSLFGFLNPEPPPTRRVRVRRAVAR